MSEDGGDLAPALPDGPEPLHELDPALGGVHDLLAGYRGADHRMARVQALIRLGRAGDPRARPALEEASQDPDWVTRKYAVSGLGAIHDPDARPALWQAFEDPHAEVRRAAARALRAVGLSMDEFGRLARDDDWHVRAVGIEGLAGQGSGDAMEVLVAAVGDPAWLIRWLAVTGLAGSPAAAPTLLAALDADPSIAAHAAATLATWAARPVDGPGEDHQAAALRGGLLARLPGAPPWKRLALARALGRIDHDDARDALASLLGHPDAEIEEAILAQGAAMAPRLRAALAAPDWIRRWHAAKLFGRLGDPASGVALLPLLRDARAEVRLAALEAVKRLAPVEGLPDLRAAMADASWHTRLAAVEAIAARPDDAGLPDVAGALADPRAEVRQAARRELARLGQARPAAVRAALAAEAVPADERAWLQGRLPLPPPGSGDSC